MASAWTQADVDALKRKIAESGDVKSTTFGDRSETSVDLKDQFALLALMQAEVNDAELVAVGWRRPKQWLGYQSGKGL